MLTIKCYLSNMQVIDSISLDQIRNKNDIKISQHPQIQQQQCPFKIKDKFIPPIQTQEFE